MIHGVTRSCSKILNRDDEAEDPKKSFQGGSLKRSGTCICKSTVLSWACALVCYFPGNSVAIVSEYGWSLCGCGVEGESKEKVTHKGIVTKEMADTCSKKVKAQSETGRRAPFLCCGDVNICPKLLLTTKILVDKRKELPLVGPYREPYFLYSWLGGQFSNVTSSLWLCVMS